MENFDWAVLSGGNYLHFLSFATLAHINFFFLSPSNSLASRCQQPRRLIESPVSNIQVVKEALHVVFPAKLSCG
jgi:hypothetical protein